MNQSPVASRQSTVAVAGPSRQSSVGDSILERIQGVAFGGVTLLVAALLTGPAAESRAPSPEPRVPISSAIAASALDADVTGFLGRELAAHLSAVTSLEPPPAAVHGAQTTGEFTWGTFMRSLAAYAQMSGTQDLAGRDLARTIAEIGLLEARLGGTRFSQLYAALSLRHYGSDLSRNPLWQTLTPTERQAWTTLLDATRFYDPVKRQVINLPENYLGVASRIAAIAYETGLLQNRALLDSLLDRAASQFTGGALYADDAVPTGRFDRYSNEYARYVWEAAQIAGRKDLLNALKPSLQAQMRLWWDLVAPDGYGYPWGRSLGVIGYMDTLEIAGFLAINPEFRPAPLRDLAAAYYRAWLWLRSDYKDERHLLSIFDFGRANYAYISRDREWQQTVGFLGKLAHAHTQLMTGLRADRIADLPQSPALRDVARFEFFRRTGRQAGVWVVRLGRVQFALPFTTGTRPGVDDYLPAPHGLAGFAVPVEQVFPALVPFLELEDGRTIVAGDGADAISPAANGRSVRATWTRWAQIGAKPTELADPGLESEIEWSLSADTLIRTERLKAREALRIRRWRVVVPTTASEWLPTGDAQAVTFLGREGTLGVRMLRSDWPVTMRARATGNEASGRGARMGIPLHLTYEAENLEIAPGKPAAWTLELSVPAVDSTKSAYAPSPTGKGRR
jgi:hypothetical protein